MVVLLLRWLLLEEDRDLDAVAGRALLSLLSVGEISTLLLIGLRAADVVVDVAAAEVANI
jgi:hypothetical protein